MLERAHHHVTAAPDLRRAEEAERVGLGAARGEGQLALIGADGARHLLARAEPSSWRGASTPMRVRATSGLP